ncbi:MAG: 3'-5' exonuclease [Planctomycetes bacterium]|nr:3'-5' exonuclease [Planctomycetota bacterium]
MKSFIAIDFETADYQRDSACALALVRVEDGRIVRRDSYLIRPPRRDFVFTYVHGITWRMVAHKPTFGELWPEISSALSGAEYLAAHNASFDRGVLEACCNAAGVRAPATPFVCSMRLARQTWGIRPTRLPDVCEHLGLSLNHHDALSDAEACAHIVLAAGGSYRVTAR